MPRVMGVHLYALNAPDGRTWVTFGHWPAGADQPTYRSHHRLTRSSLGRLNRAIRLLVCSDQWRVNPFLDGWSATPI